MKSALYESEKLRSVTGPFIRPGALSLTDRAVEYCAFGPESVVIDVGCGFCGTLEHLRNVYRIKAYGIDPSEVLLAAGRSRAPFLPAVQGIAETVPFRSHSLDGVFCECVFSLLPDRDHALREFSRVLKPEGFLVITDVFLRASLAVAPGVSREGCCIAGARSRDEIEKCLEGQGFSIVHWEDHTRALKELAAQLILAHGSLDDFWSPACSSGKRGLHGYFLLIARNRAA